MVEQPSQDPAAEPQTGVAGYPQQVMSPQQLAAIQQAAAQQAAMQQGTPTPVVAVPASAAPVAATPVAAAPPREVFSEPVHAQVREEIRIYSHSPLAYWWPVWLVGFILAAISYFGGTEVELAPGIHSVFYPRADLGVAFVLTLFLVILITNVVVRGLASALVIVSVILSVVILGYFRLWDPILSWFAGLNVYLNTGAYFWFSTLMFLTWGITVFVVDHMSYWTIKPGQITESFVLGASSRSFDTQNIVIEKFRDDLFRHWILGMGSGDLRIETQGGHHEEVFLPNVFFIGSKIDEIQKLIATRPTEFGSPTIM
jgi:hypothetical protein